MTTSTGVRRRLPPAERREQIASVTQTLISERGYWGLTMADVAKAAGVTVQAVLHHFPSKDELMVAVLDRRDADDLRTVEGPDYPVRDVFDFIDLVSRLVERNAARPELIRMYSILHAESLNPDHPAHLYFQRRYDQGVRELARLATGWSANSLAVGIHVHAMLDGLQLACLTDPRIDPAREWREWAYLYFQVRPSAGPGQPSGSSESDPAVVHENQARP